MPPATALRLPVWSLTGAGCQAGCGGSRRRPPTGGAEQNITPPKTAQQICLHQPSPAQPSQPSPAQPSPEPGAGSGRAEEEAALIELLTVGGCWCTLKLLCTALTLHPAPTPGILDVDYYLHKAVYSVYISCDCLDWSLMS